MGNPQGPHSVDKSLKQIQFMLYPLIVFTIALIMIPMAFLSGDRQGNSSAQQPIEPVVRPNFWIAQDPTDIKDAALANDVVYGRELIVHTAKYLGPQGSVSQITNGLNCQNCHLEAGTKPWGNNYGSVASTYPKMRPRSGKMEDVFKRVNDCMERSLNGQALDTNSRELHAIRSYILYAGGNVPKKQKAIGSGLHDLPYLDRAADPDRGKQVYVQRCESCHGQNGLGASQADLPEYTYPPLWGQNSYNDGAGLFRISNLAKYVKFNMPLGVTWENPLLSDEEAWDVAAYVNSQLRPHFDATGDWPDQSKKPIDHPFAPYADNFPEHQHKYGPFKPMLKQ
jgi:thiosulfate dehydrogenase